MTRLKLAILISAFLQLSGAQAADGQDPNMQVDSEAIHKSFISGAVKKSDRDVLIPKPLVGMIQERYIEAYRATHPEEDIDEVELTIEIPRRLLQVTMYLRAKTPGVLKDGDYRYSLPTGGGTIDLAQAVQNHIRGTFYVEIDIRVEGSDEPAPVDVFFVSNAKSRNIDRREFGMGCNKFAEITDYFKKSMNDKGFVVNTTEQRYISVLAGTFFFVWPQAEALHIGSLTLEDSRFPRIQCRKN